MEFMKKVEQISKKIGETATETYNTVVDKSGKIIEGTKSKMSITDKEEKIYEIYADMGRTVYEMYQKGEDVGEAFREESMKIDQLNKEIEEIKKKMLELKGLKECCQCEKVIPKDSNFCKFCGVKQDKVELVETKVEDNKNEKVCPSCNMVCEEDAEFCPGCGAELK